MYFICFRCIFINFLLWKTCLIFCLCYYLFCRRKNNHFDLHFRWIGPVFLRRKIEKMRSMKEEMDGEVFISRQSRHFSFLDKMIKVLFPICTLNWQIF